MRVLLTHEESEELFLTALCNGLEWVEGGYDLELTYDLQQYQDARKKDDGSGYELCHEDILMSILRKGGSLTMEDIGCEGEYTRTITMKDVHEQVQNTNIRHLMDAINENGDAITADVILQQVFFNEIIFG